MWFLFGIITFVSVCCYQVHKRLTAAWSGDEATSKNIKYQYDFQTNKGDVNGLLIGISGPKDLNFTLKREKTTDRFFKFVGIAKEHQTGNQAFDDLIYVLSDHEALHQHISRDEKLLSSILKIFEYTWSYSSKVEEIRCQSGRIWLRLKIKDKTKNEQPDLIAEKLVPLLKNVADNLNNAGIKQFATYKDPFVIKAAVILAISSGLFINGFLHGFRILWQEVPYTLDITQFRTTVAAVSIAIICSLIVSTFYFLGRSARTHLVLIELFIMGTAGAVFTAGSLIRDLNMDLDSAEPQRHIVVMYDKRMSTGRRSNNYYLFVDDWLDKSSSMKNVLGENLLDENALDTVSTRRVSVSSDFYHSVRTGDELIIVQKPGYLNYRWVERITKMEPES